MEVQPIFALKPLPLTDIVLRSIVVKLCSGHDFLSWISNMKNLKINYKCPKMRIIYEKLEEEVKDKLLKLALPEKLKKQLMYLVKPIGSEIQKWVEFHRRYLNDLYPEMILHILENLHWTPSGVINYIKSAEELIHCEDLDIVERYKLACLHCLENYISVLWEKLTEDIKTKLYHENSLKIVTNKLYYFWPFILKGEESKLDKVISPEGQKTFNQHAFELSAYQGNKSATNYFFQKLSHQEREILIPTIDNLVNFRRVTTITLGVTFPLDKLSEVLCYLLSLLTPEEQLRIYSNHSAYFLSCFLDWPLQNYCQDLSDRLWTFLPKQCYRLLIKKVKKLFNSSGYYFPKLFQQLFICSPVNFKKYFMCDPFEVGDLLTIFFKNQDSETVEVIFRSVDVDDRVQLVFSYKFFKIMNGLLMENQWHLVKLCFQEATLSEEDKERLKITYTEFMQHDSTIPAEWERFFQSFNKITTSHGNRSSDGDSETETKRICLEDS